MGIIGNLLQFPFRQRQQKALECRDRTSKNEFIKILTVAPEDESAAIFIWDFLVEAAMIEGFSPDPNDNFHWMYGLAEEDLDEDLILELLKRISLAAPSLALMRQIGEVATPQKLMQLIRLARESQSSTKV